MVEVTGLPAGASLLLLVPARQPLPPGAAISLFAQSNGQFADTGSEGLVTVDGQFIAFSHAGGVMAAGTGGSNQPFSSLVASGVTLSQSALNINRAKVILLAIQQQALAQLMVQPAHCPPGNCAGLQPCFSSELIASHTCANGSVASQGTTALHTGRTHCDQGGVHCFGSVGLFPDMVPAPEGHGTACSFVGFTQPTVNLVCGTL